MIMANIDCWATGDVFADARKSEAGRISVWLRVGSVGYVSFSVEEAREAVDRLSDAITNAVEMQGGVEK